MDIAQRRLLKALANQEQEAARYRQGGGAGDIDMCAAPNWSRDAWEQFKAAYGHYPFDQSRRPPSMAGAPDWVYELMGQRRPPIEVHGGPISS